MVISILVRKTRVKDRAGWESALQAVLPKVRQVVEAEPGFVSLQYLWSPDEEGAMAQITTWQSLDDCRRYVRGGAAATAATIEDAAIPTAPHPDGAWVRKNFEVAG
ncbi:MAG: hypothetical protein Q7T33_03295 [Dehalococcoidia bacterium]|nr:hypothetical protein [Dehalococcoidia bacterium]